MSRQQSANTFDVIWKEIKVHLETEKNRVVEAIRNYPPPITACDEQFDQLLEDREAISRELARLREAHEASQSVADPSAVIQKCTSGSPFVSAAAAKRICAQLK